MIIYVWQCAGCGKTVEVQRVSSEEFDVPPTVEEAGEVDPHFQRERIPHEWKKVLGATPFVGLRNKGRW